MIVSLRAIAALMVCFFHFSSHDNDLGSLLPADSTIRKVGFFGHHGVSVFFVISGFVIPLSMYYGKYNIQNFVRFLGKRMVRLHPPFVLSMVLYAVMEVVYWYRGGYDIVYDFARIANNFFLTARICDYHWYQDVYWTLAIELQYYIIIGLALPLILFSKKWVSLLTLVALVCSSFFFGHEMKHYFFFHTPVFVLGIVLFLHHIGRINLFELLVYSFFCLWMSYHEIAPACMYFIAFTALVIYAVHIRSKILEWVGEISYSLYLTHGFSGLQLIYYLAPMADTMLKKVALLMGAFPVSILFAYIFYRVIEVPSVRWSQRIKYKIADQKATS